MHEPDTHVSPIKHWVQPVIGIGLALVATIVVLVLLTQYVTDAPSVAKDDDSAVLSRIKPVGELQLAVASGPKGHLTGEQVYNQVCKTCHEGGLAGAPKVGDKTAWAKVIAPGLKASVERAIAGVRAMPPKGGNPDLENIEVERAVVFMANRSGANWKEPPLPVMAAAATPAALPVVGPAAGLTQTAAAPASGKPDGKKIYDAACMVCHGAGVAGAPKFGDKAAWVPRLNSGMDALYASSIKGKGAMPAKGGNASLADADIKAAVDYMATAAK